MSLIMKDQAKRQRQRMLDEHEAHWHEEEKRIISGKIFFACLMTMILIALLAVYMPVEAGTAWQSISNQSLVDQFGEE